MSKLHCYHGKVTPRRQMLVKVRIAPAGWWEDVAVRDEKPRIMPVTVDAILDTGANISCIASALGPSLELPIIYSDYITTGDKTSEKNFYKVDIQVLLPGAKSQTGIAQNTPSRDFYGHEVVETYSKKDRFVIIGMDIIMQGELRVKGRNFTLCL